MFIAGWSFESGTIEGWFDSAAGSPPVVESTYPKTGAYGIRIPAGRTSYGNIGSALPDAFLQVCNRQSNWMDGLRFGLLYNTTWVAYVSFNAIGNPTLFYRGGAASVGPLVEYNYDFDVQHTIEIELTTIDASADVVLRIDGDILLSATAVDTRAASGAITAVNRVGIINPFTATCSCDDIVVFDHSGTYNNSWPDGVGGTRRGMTADGTYEEMTPSTGTDHTALINEVPATSVGYVQADAAGERDSFIMQPVTGLYTGAADILAYQTVHLSHEPNGPSARTIDPFIRVDGVDHQDGVDHALDSAMAFYPGKLWETNPETDLPWTAAELDDIEPGIKSGA